MGADSVAGVIIDLSVSGAGQVAEASDRIQAKLKSVEQAGVTASAAADRSSLSTEKASKALDDFDTRLEVSYSRLRRTVAVLERLAKKAAEVLGDDEASEKIEATGTAFRDALQHGAMAYRIGSAVGGPEVGAAAAAVVGVGTFAYEEITSLQAINEKNAAAARKIAREEIEFREQKRSKESAASAREYASFLEDEAQKKAETAKLNAALGGGIFGQ